MKKKEPMNYFAAIRFRAEQLDELAQAYLNKFEFMNNEDILKRLWAIAQKMFKDIGGTGIKLKLFPSGHKTILMDGCLMPRAGMGLFIILLVTRAYLPMLTYEICWSVQKGGKRKNLTFLS